MSDHEKLLSRYRYIARGLGFQGDCEDIAQEAYLGGLKNPHWKQTARQRVIEAIRGIYGRTVGGICRDPLLNRLVDEYEEEIQLSSTGSSEEARINGYDFKRAVEVLQGEERVIFFLIYVWGFKEKEVGDCFGVSESRISQRLKKIQKNIQNKIRGGAETREPGVQGIEEATVERELEPVVDQ